MELFPHSHTTDEWFAKMQQKQKGRSGFRPGYWVTNVTKIKTEA
jgi:hypothetical protein